MPHISENFGDLLEPGLNEIYQFTLNEKPMISRMLYREIDSDKSQEKDSMIGGFGLVDEFNGKVNFDAVSQGYDKTYIHKEYAKGFAVDRKLYDDDQYNQIAELPRALALATRRTIESHSAGIFNNAFNASYPGADGVELCSAVHTSPGSGGANQSNIASGGQRALSSPNLQKAREAMQDLRDDRSLILDVNPDILLVPPELEETAWTMMNTAGKLNTANNDANYQFGLYRVITWSYLSDSTAWFLLDSTYMKMFLKWFWRVRPEFKQAEDFDGIRAKYRAYMRYSYGFSDWRWLFGSPGE